MKKEHPGQTLEASYINQLMKHIIIKTEGYNFNTPFSKQHSYMTMTT